MGWGQEAALRMLQNNLDPEVAEHPDKLVVYGGTGKAARNWESFDALVKTLTHLKDDETNVGPIWKACRGIPNSRVGTASSASKFQFGGRLGDVAGIPSTRRSRAHHVWPDDCLAHGSTLALKEFFKAPMKLLPLSQKNILVELWLEL
jgi:hypothetical protein